MRGSASQCGGAGRRGARELEGLGCLCQQPHGRRLAGAPGEGGLARSVLGLERRHRALELGHLGAPQASQPTTPADIRHRPAMEAK